MRTYHQVDFIEEHQIVKASVESEAACTTQNDVIWVKLFSFLALSFEDLHDGVMHKGRINNYNWL